MQQITISKEAYDRMVMALTMVACAIENAKDDKVDTDVLTTVLECADFPRV